MTEARIDILNARKANQSVIFRRGPSKWVQLLKWDTDTDEIKPGQWFNGRIYSSKSDISPYGDYLIYFAAKFRENKNQYSWTAISKPSYFTALGIWKKVDTFDGGGFFESTRRIYISQTKLNLDFEAKTDLDQIKFKYKSKEFPFDNIESKRMIRDGWKWSKIKEDNLECSDLQIVKDISSVTQLFHLGQKIKGKPNQFSWSRKLRYKSKIINLDDFNNIDSNTNGRILLSKKGCIYAIDNLENFVETESPNLILDLNPNEPYELKAPEEMVKW